MIRAVVAYDQNRAIGANNELLWGFGEMKSDMRRFREKTFGHTVLMGRKTYESIGKPLPGRRNIVISRTMSDTEGVEIADGFDTALGLCGTDVDIDVIGGGEIYKQALPQLDAIIATEVLHRFAHADTYFPVIDNEWHATESEQHDADENNIYPYRFVTYER